MAWRNIGLANGPLFAFTIKKFGRAVGQPGRFQERRYIFNCQYARIVRDWVTSFGLKAGACGTHSMRRTEVNQICKKTGSPRAVQLLLGHLKMDSTVRYLGVEVGDTLAIAEAIEI